jgi:cytochrome c-type biogenesis protein CcmH
LFWILTICLFVLACLFVLLPVWLRQRSSNQQAEELRASANIALFHERVNDLESDLATGDIDKAQFDRLLLELQQNLLADTESENDGDKQSGSDTLQAKVQNASRMAIVVPVVLALLVPVAAYVLYERWGYFDNVSLTDLFERTMESAGNPQEAQELIVALGNVVQENGELPWAWYFLGENFANIGMFEEAQISYQRASELLEDDREKALVLGRVALAMYVNAGLEFTPDLSAVIAEARRLNPNEVSVLQLLAADAEQNQDWGAAIDYWRLLIQRDPNSPEAQELRNNIAAAQQMLQREEGAASGPVIEVALSLGEGVEIGRDISNEQIVFVAARNAEQEGLPPLAAVRMSVAELPALVRLDNSSAVGPFNLSSAQSVFITATISQTGVATAASGDYRVESEVLAIGDPEEVQRIELELSERLQ